jgi:glycosyltransferase involved in cell wall biosynthesis/SAM-dependent methyltransferase
MKWYGSVCTLCGARDFLPFGQRTDGIRVLQCAVCGHGIVEHFEDDVHSLYGDQYFSAAPASAVGYQDYAFAAEHGVAWAPSLLRLLKVGGQVLDVGCANGSALRLLGEGYDCFGIELNEGMAQQATRAGVRMIARDLLDRGIEPVYSGYFDAVLAIAVFEHIPDFKEAFRTATALLKPDGILIFEVPLVQFAGDIWYRSSLEHIHYPTESSIKYLFREILHLPLTGSVIDVQDFGATYIGVTSRDTDTAHRAGAEYLRLTTSDPALLQGDQARFRWYLDLIHAAQSRPEILALYRHLNPEDWSAASLHRIFQLWAYREEKLKYIVESYPREVGLKTKELAELVASQQQELENIAGAKDWLEEQLRNGQRAAEEQRQRIVELEKAKTGLAQRAENWRAAAEQRSERITLLEQTILRTEQTILRMRATRAWRTAEWSVGVLRRLSGVCRTIMLVGSPRLASSNARNFLLWLRLVFGGGERRAIWSAHFDAAFYERANPDVERSGIYPGFHYLVRGYLENRNPSESFDSAYYRSRYADVRVAGINPLLHYVVFGHQEQRSMAPSRTPTATRLLSHPLPGARPHRADNEAPLVSVVIPCFNYGQYVEQAIHSVLSQTFTNFEIVVVEGGSTDDTTAGILRDLERKGLPRTRFFYRTESHLVGDNRNIGISLARGRYVCCLDADDLIKPTYLEIAVFLAEFCGYDVVYPSVNCFGESVFRWLLDDPMWPKIADANQISTVAMFRRAAWAHVGGFRDWGKGERYVPEDWEFWVRLVGNGFRGKSIQEPLMLYRVHGSGLWGTCRSTVEDQCQAIREANPQFFVDGFVPATASLDRPDASWDDLIEPAESHPHLLLALPFIAVGGAEKLFETLMRSLIRRGYKVVVITTLVLAEAIRDCTESFEAITPYLYPLPRVLQGQEDRWWSFLFYLLKRHEIGTILIAGCDFVYRLLPEIAREFPQVAILDQLFNDEVHYYSNRHYAAYIDATSVPSQKLADKLICEGHEEAGRVCVIPHGINIEEMAAPEAAFDSSGLPEHFRGKFLVSFFGRLSPEKAPADFVRIARRLRSYDGICFLMTGEGPERAAVEALIERYELRDRVYAPGFVDDVRTLMALSDVVVVPSSLDGMPLVVFEAQACGKPVVASSVGSIPYVIADGETGLLCPPGDVNGFAERILRLWRSPDLRRAIGDAARIWVRANHSAEAMTARYVEAFDRARARSQARSTAATNGAGERKNAPSSATGS